MKQKIILLVEDNPDDAVLTEHALQSSNLCNEIVHVPDGVAALDYLFARGVYAGRDTTEQPALILLDLNMPKLGGLEVLNRIRNDERTRRLPVVILTTSKHDEDIVASYDLGANSYVTKPVDFEEFTKAASTLGLYWLLMNQHPNK